MEKLNKKLKSFKKTVTSIRRGKNKNAKPDIQELQQSLCILSEENLAVRKQLKEKQLEIEKLKQENLALKRENETKKVLFEEDTRFLCDEIKSLKSEISEKYMEMEKVKEDNLSFRKKCKRNEMFIKEERTFNETLKQEKYKLEQQISKLNKDMEDVHRSKVNKLTQEKNNKTLNNTLTEEVESLRVIVELKQNEIKTLQMALADAKQKETGFEVAMRKVALLSTKCEDLQEQLKNKSESEQILMEEVSKLRKIIFEENTQMRRLSYQNEELQWKLQCNRKTTSKKSTCGSQISPSKIRKVVKKRQSIGYILDLDDNPKRLKKIENR